MGLDYSCEKIALRLQEEKDFAARFNAAFCRLRSCGLRSGSFRPEATRALVARSDTFSVPFSLPMANKLTRTSPPAVHFCQAANEAHWKSILAQILRYRKPFRVCHIRLPPSATEQWLGRYSALSLIKSIH